MAMAITADLQINEMHMHPNNEIKIQTHNKSNG
jgi:hypothetical protein